MKKSSILLPAGWLLAALLFVSCTVEEPPFGNPPEFSHPGTSTTVSSNGGPLFLVHYMPWYRGPSNRSQEGAKSSYGGHWTNWGKLNPQQHDANGKAQIFSKHYPLTGPYHSGNTELLEYQACLMKIAGIDGVIFDWYGSYEANDFGEIHVYTNAMVDVLRRAKLFYSLCYEDNTINMMNPEPNKTEALKRGKVSFDFAQEYWFWDPQYVRYQGKPLVLCFGPQYFNSKSDWDTVFSGTDPKPWFTDLDRRNTWADSSFNWPPMWASSGTPKILTQERLIQYLDEYYNSSQRNKPYRVASVFPAFEDAYADSYGLLAYDNGKVFDLTWQRAIQFNPHVIQIVTWNDYGEGTIIEPTIERGYKELEYIQAKVKETNKDFPFTAADLRWPLEFYRLRYAQTNTSAKEAAIKAAVSALFAGDAVRFRTEAAKLGVTINENELKPILRQ